MGTSSDYTLTCENDKGHAVLTGQLALSSPTSFDELFSEIKTGIERASESYTIDVSGVHFMSSSGITSLARVVLHASMHKTKLILKIDDTSLWQRKSLVALKHLWEGLVIEVVNS